MSKVMVDREWLKQLHRDLDACQKVIWSGLRGADPAYCQDAQVRLKEIDELLAQPAEAEGTDVQVVAYQSRETGEFYEQSYGLDSPLELVLRSDHLAALSAVTAERDRLAREAKNDAIAYRAVIERQEELRAEAEALRKDAERYRMFRRGMFDPDRFDADIDAAMAAKEVV